ncbi:MAG TPA: protein phosphatase 2C domain-containing protein [Bacillota bacterium]|nr:protein phosphatase 2C domain-containing protein [Bacillota bacterium]
MGDAVLRGNLVPKDLEVYGRTDKGRVRPHNEDYFGHYVPPDIHIKNKWGSLFVVSDGVGGNAAGEVASAEAVNVLLQEYYFGDHTQRLPERLKSVYQYTAMHVFDLSSSHPSVRNMQCTLTALLIRQNKFFISHVGDSKVFLLRSQKLMQLTKDHTLVGKMVRLGLITPEAARTHPNKHLLLHALGEQPLLPADFYSGNILPGDLFVLLTDGILEHMTEEELKSFLLEKGYTDQGLKQLVNLINARGGYDNMTIMSVKVNEVN